MSYRHAITAFLMLAVAALACSVGSTATTVPPTNAPATSAVASKTPVNFHNGGVTPEGPTEEATAEEQPTKAPTKVPTKAPTKPPKPTATTEAANTGCDTFKASTDVYWVTLDKDSKIQDTVTSYPDGTNEIVPVFEYDCNPKSFQIVTIFSLDGKEVFSDKDTLKATDQHDLYGYPLVTKSGGSFDTGEWGVEFYNAKQLVASGKVAVGGGSNNTNDNQSNNSSTVTIQGTITNKSGGKPIAGAVFVVLNEGINIDQFVKDNYADADIFTGATANSSGEFTLPDGLKRNTDYSIVVAAKGFKTLAVDGFNIDDKQPDPLVVDVQLSK